MPWDWLRAWRSRWGLTPSHESVTLGRVQLRGLLFGALIWGACSACEKKPSPTADAPSQTASVAASAAPAAHPNASAATDTVSAASETAYDAGPSVLGASTVDGAALRKRHVERLKTDRSAVSVLSGGDALSLGEAICEAVMPKRPKSTPILLKPNLCGFDGIVDPDKHKGDDGVVGRTTDVAFTRGVVRCLKKRGHDKITIAEGCGISHQHWQRVIAITGYESMAKEEGVALVAMDDDGVFDVEGNKPGLPLGISGIGASRVPTLLMPKVLAEHLDHGLFVSLPKVKAHRYSVTSMAIKGMQGTVMYSDARPAYKQKARSHRELNEQLKAKKAARAAAKADASPPPPTDAKAERAAYVASLAAFAERMLDVLEISTPDVVLAEAAPGMGGDGFWQLHPTDEKVAIGGTNPVSVDRVGAELLGLWDNARLGSELLGNKTSPLITIAAKRYGLDLAQTKLEGSGAGLFGKPRPFHYRSMAGFELHSANSPAWQPVAPRFGASAPASSAAPAAAGAPASSSGLPAPTPAPPAAGQREAHAVALGSERVKLDGKFDEPVWTRAPSISWDTDWSGARTGVVTRVRFAWAKDALYVLFELEGAGLFVDRTRSTQIEREKLYQEDCVELFLGHDASNPRHYLEVELGPFGHFFDLEVRLGGAANLGWSSGVGLGTSRDASAQRAVIEAKLSAPEIIGVLSSGARLPLGLYRMEGSGQRKYLAWSPTLTKKPNFHVPDKFGVLVVD